MSAPTHDALHYEIWSLNGFRVRHAGGARPTEPIFDVSRGRDGAPEAVAVAFAPAVIDACASAAGHRLDHDVAFWARHGGRALVRHLWTCAEPPPSRRLIVRFVSDEMLTAAGDTGVSPA